MFSQIRTRVFIIIPRTWYTIYFKGQNAPSIRTLFLELLEKIPFPVLLRQNTPVRNFKASFVIFFFLGTWLRSLRVHNGFFVFVNQSHYYRPDWPHSVLYPLIMED